MGRKSRLKQERKAVVQGAYTLASSIQVLRENIFVGDTPIKSLSEEHLDIIINGNVGSAAFQEVCRREMVYRIENMFTRGFEEQEKKQKLKDSISNAFKGD